MCRDSMLALICLYSAVAIQLLQMPFMVVIGRRLGFAIILQSLPALGQAFVRLFVRGIVMCVSGLALLVLVNASDLPGNHLGKSLLAFLAVFSAYRLLNQMAMGRLWPDDVPRAAHWFLLGVHSSTTMLYSAAFLLMC